MDQEVLGFDVREMLRPPATAWSDERRAFALLQPDVLRPLSIDASCWLPIIDVPDVFLTGSNIMPVSAQLPTWTGANKGMWDRLSDLVEFCRGCRVPRDWYWLVAFSVVEDVAFQTYQMEVAEKDRLIFTGVADPPRPDANWRFLGFDVADGGHCSALMNCPATDLGERQRLASYQSVLNAHHLFQTLADAERYRQYSDERIPEHAPFFVFGLYQVDGDQHRLPTC